MIERELLLYIAAKVARLDAITRAIHAILLQDLKPEDTRQAEQRKWVLLDRYRTNIEAEKAHLRVQFPTDYKLIDQHISLGETELLEKADAEVSAALEGRLDIPESFREPPEGEDQKDQT